MFLVLQSDQVKSEDLLGLSPEIMRWSNSIWIVDYSWTASYWQKRSLICGTSVAEMFRGVLNYLLEDGWVAVISERVFQGILMVRTLKDRKMRGLLNGAEAFGQSFMKQVDWSVWFAEARHFGEVCEKLCQKQAFKGFRAPTFWKGLKHFEQAVARLSTKLDWYLQNIDSGSIQRRFGVDVAKVWSLTVSSTRSQHDAQVLTRGREADFPWDAWEVATPAFVQRISESVLCAWDHLEGFLREDLDRLVRSLDEGEAVLAYEWLVRLTNGKEIRVEVPFRNPLFAQRECGEHKSSLAQCFFAFQKFRDESEEMIGIEGWTLGIARKMRMPTWFRSLFSSEQDEQFEKIIGLDHLLNRPLTTFALTTNWIPEASFSKFGVEQGKAQENVPHARARFAERPFFIYEKITPYNLAHAKKMVFLERVSTQWWETADAVIERDYYRVTDRTKKDLWVYLEKHEGKTRAFVQGIYG